ncbi:MAG TPA: SMP-30/gluconolactonase/LRE family protein [Candidatus Cybelea sp.]|jgi:sugar lactone lactonase YvrE|nr:SMP-30/gluconolactonase/LRE family protein [Candidatus Cybelea sp.]
MRFRLVITGAFVVPFLAACATGPATTPAQAPTGAGAQSVRADVRFGLNREQLQAADARRGKGYFDKSKRKPTLFVSDIDSDAIRIFPANKKNPTQKGSITDGIDTPVNVAVDPKGTLYVANNGNSTVTEYPFGATSPSATLSGAQLIFPNGIAVDNKGTVYVTTGATAGVCSVLVYPKGASSPSEQINGFDLPVGLAIDKSGNLYVGDALQNAVWEVPAGSTTPTKLSLSGLHDPTGLAIDPKNNLWVTNDQSNTVLGFHLGETTAFATITAGLSGPYSIAFEKTGTLFVGNSLHYPGDVAVYKSGKTTPFESFNVANPAGLAAYPKPKD